MALAWPGGPVLPVAEQSTQGIQRHFTLSRRSCATTKASEEGETSDKVYAPAQSAYIHLPFCKKKCLYCDFPVIAIGTKERNYKNNMNSGDMVYGYVDALCREIEATAAAELVGCHDRRTQVGLQTIYFGGGTPSLLPLILLEKIILSLESCFGIETGAEISIEADPGTFDADRLRSYKNLGITRASVGVQAFDDSLLELCGRSHTLYDVYRAVEDVHNADFSTWSLDLISGLPELTMATWEKNLLSLVDTEAPHSSIYDLQVEEGTPFARMYKPGVSPLPTDEDSARMYAAASVILRSAGYEHYEISSYAKPDHRCKHNLAYWDGKEYFAFGMGAASHRKRRRFSRPNRYHSYLRWVGSYEKASREARSQGIELHPSIEAVHEQKEEDILTDTIMLQMRKSDGLDLGKIETEYTNGTLLAQFILESVAQHIDEGYVEYDSETKSLRLTDPKGFLLSNDIISDIFAAIDKIIQSP